MLNLIKKYEQKDLEKLSKDELIRIILSQQKEQTLSYPAGFRHQALPAHSWIY